MSVVGSRHVPNRADNILDFIGLCRAYQDDNKAICVLTEHMHDGLIYRNIRLGRITDARSFVEEGIVTLTMDGREWADYGPPMVGHAYVVFNTGDPTRHTVFYETKDDIARFLRDENIFVPDDV